MSLVVKLSYSSSSSSSFLLQTVEVWDSYELNPSFPSLKNYVSLLHTLHRPQSKQLFTKTGPYLG